MVYDDDFDHILPGNKVVLTGKLLAHEGPSNLGENDMRIYYLSRNIGFTMFPDKKETLGQEKNFWKSRLFSIRNRMSEHLSSQYGEEIRPIFEAMILGDKTDISEDLKDTFTQSGIVHILAISGLHISLAGAGIYRRLRGAGVSLCLSGAAGLMFAFSYCVMTGMSGSSKRALLMFFFFVLSQICGRSYDLLSSGGVSAFAGKSVQMHGCRIFNVHGGCRLCRYLQRSAAGTKTENFQRQTDKPVCLLYCGPDHYDADSFIFSV